MTEHIYLPREANHEFIRVMTHATVEKRTEEYDTWYGNYLAQGFSEAEARKLAEIAVPPYEIVEGDYNQMSNAGIDALLLLLVGGGGQVFDNAHTYVGVGDSSSAFAASQTNLQAATNKLRKAMDATYPVTGTHLMTFKGTYATGDANWAWNEWGIFNDASAGTMLNRKVESLGTKVSGSWALAVTFALA